MSQRQPHEQIRRAFSELTRPPRPQLSERVRDSLWGRSAPATRRGRSGLPVSVPALVAAVVILALIAGVALEGPAAVGFGRGLASRLSRTLGPPATATKPGSKATPSASPAPRTSPSSGTSPSPAPAPTETPTPASSAPAAPAPAAPAAPAPPVPVTLPGFSCSAQSGGGGQATMVTARVGAQTGYNRFVIQFSGGVPRFEVTPQDSASFAQSGGAVTLRGAAGVAVVLHDASGAGVFTGPTDMQPSFSSIQEARLLSDSQGTVEWGIGIARPACFHAWTLSGPARLVVDVADP